MLNSKTMTAAVLTGPYELEMQEVPIPEINDDEVLVEVLSCGICTTDVELYDGSQPYLHNGMTALPLIMGHEWCGKVAAMGKDVEGFNIGEKVVGDVSIGCGKCPSCMKGNYHLCDHRREIGVIFYNGAFAEYLKIPYKNLYKVDDSVSPLTAMFIEPAATSVRAAMRTEVQFGDRVVVFGDGAIGLFAAQAAKAMGASKVAVVSIADNNKALVESWGMDFINSRNVPVKDFLKENWGCEQVDVTFEATGDTSVVNDAIEMTLSGGKICQISFAGRPVTLDLDSIVCRDIKLIGTLASPNAFIPTMRMMANGQIHVDGMLTQKYTLEQTPEAFDFVKMKRGPRIKVGILKSLDIE